MTYGLPTALAETRRLERQHRAARHRHLGTPELSTFTAEGRDAKLASRLRRQPGLMLIEAGLHLICRTSRSMSTSPARG